MTNDTTTRPDLNNPGLYLNRELSQIEFNRRVLEESFNRDHPLLERVKFVAIFAANMDEFFMVRVSGLKQQVALGVTDRPPDGLLPREQLVAIHRQVTGLVARARESWRQLQGELAQAGVQVLDYADLKPGKQRKLSEYFELEVFPVLTPLAFDPGHPFPHISNLSVSLAVWLRDPDTGETHFARVKVPASLPRLVPVKPLDPDDYALPAVQRFVWLEQVIAANLGRLFPGMEILESHPFRVTRNTDMDIQEEEADDLLLTIENNLRRRHFGKVVRLEVDRRMSDHVLRMLLKNLQISQHDVYAVDGPLGLSHLMHLQRLELPALKDPYFTPNLPAPLRTGENIFEVIKRQDILLHRPYDSFAPVIDFVRQAAEDPQVLSIKMTLYRVGPEPPVVQALMKARENGKQVTALVELKARFDEESNIEWARALEKVGVHVVYGLIGLKVHCKLLLVVRREDNGLRRYLHLSTGNYNAITARVYSDLDFLTADEDLGADATELFNVLTGYSKQREYRKFLVAPVNFRQQISRLIERETAHGPNGRIVIKINSLVDQGMIRLLYRASQAGVKVDLIVRSLCCLRPGIEGISENIRVISIVGRFLEHARIYYFHNQGDPTMYIGSADLMPRNIDRRVEVMFPVENPALRADILENILEVQLRDKAKGHRLQADGTYIPLCTLAEPGEELLNSQLWFLNGHADPAVNSDGSGPERIEILPILERATGRRVANG